MAKIRKEEIIDTGILTEHIKQLEQVLALNKELDSQYKKTAKARKNSIGGADVNNVQGIKKVNQAVQESINLKKASIAVDKDKVRLDKQLKAATDEQVKGKLRLQEANRKQRELLKEEIALENKQIGTLNKLAIANKKLNREKKALDLSTKQGTTRLKQINAEMNRNTAIVNKNATANGKLKANIGNYKSALGGATAGLKKFAGALGLTSGIFLLIRGIKSSISTIADFEQGTANLASILGTTKDKIVALTEDAKRLGAATSFSASQVSELQTEFAKLGFNEQQIINATEATLDLAAATGAELGEAAAIAGATLGGFGLAASETQRVTDVMAKSFSTSALDMEKFKESMKEAAPAAKAVGIDIEKTTALLGTLSNAGITGSKAGGALKTGFIELNAAGIDLDTALEKIANSQDKLATATELVGKRAATSFLVLADGVETTKELELGFDNAGGAAKKMADEQLDTLSGSVKLLKSAWEGVVLSLTDGNGALNGLKNTIKFVATNLKTIIKVLGFVTKAFIAFKVVMFSLKMGDRIKDFKTYNKEVGKSGTAMTGAATKAKAFGKALKGIGLAVALTLLIELAVAFYDIASGAAEARRQQDLFNEAQKNSSEFGEKFNNITDERIKKKTQELELLVSEGKLTQKQMDLQLQGLQIEKEKNALKIVDRSNEKIKLLREENEQLRIKADLDSKNIKNDSNLRGFEKIERENNLRNRLTQELKDNNNQIVQQNEIVKEFSNIATSANDTIHDYTVNIADNTLKTNANTKAIEDNTKAKDQAEIEEQRIFDLRQQRLSDQADNEKENEKIREENAKKEADRVAKQNADQEKAEEQRRERERLAEEKRLKQFKENIKLTADLLKAAADARESKLDNEIDSAQDRIDESQQTVNNLQAQANLGNLDAQASIKAEKEAIANEKLNIESLEKKKRNLQILVTGLAVANEKIQSGDGNALVNAGADMASFISKLKGFYDGTETTLGADLGNAYAITGDRDTHIIKAHKDEHIIGVENSRKLGNMNQDDIVKGALMLKNGEFVNNRVIGNMTNVNAFNDARMITAMNKIEKSINNIKIPEHKFNYDAISKMAIEQMKVGNKTTNNHTKIGGRLW